MKYINVITALSTKALDRLFTYAVPVSLCGQIKVGSIVMVPFGKKNQLQKAYVIEVDAESPAANIEVKEVHSVLSGYFLTEEQIELALWMKQYYVATLSSVFKLMLPPSLDITPRKEVSYYINPDSDFVKSYQSKIKGTRFQKRNELITYFMENGMDSIPPLTEQSFYSKAVLDTLLKDDIIRKVEITPSVIAPYLKNLTVTCPPAQLNSEQATVVEAIQKDFKGVHLIHGITGSGKTEIYFSLMEKVLKEGKQVIVLFPEIALTFALVQRFISRFGQQIGLFHSRLSEGEKRSEWDKARNGQTRIMIGPRSALFAPFENLGLIIMDEEQESSYKSEFMPKYHATEVAARIAKIKGIPLVLGSATPSLESYYYAQNGRFHLHKLKTKALTEETIEVSLIDMRNELENGNRSFLSLELKESITKALHRKEQVILLNNRRGYAKFISCRKCGYVPMCPHCEMPLTYHKTPEHMQCHHCNYKTEMSKTCPKCQSRYLKAFGMGTQKMELELKKMFPDTTVVRMDYDTTKTKHGHAKRLQEFSDAESGILIGTQMIAKGLDFHNVTVVGVIAMDQGLYSDDYRAAERSFQLLTQVIGRTGRGGKKGKALIQTYSPEHFAIQYGILQDYEGFYAEELVYRKLLNNTPFKEILEIVLSYPSQKELDIMSTNITQELKKMIQHYGWEIEVSGPLTPYLFKHADRFRKIILLKANRHKELTFIMNSLYNKKIEKMGFTLQMDINPQYFS